MLKTKELCWKWSRVRQSGISLEALEDALNMYFLELYSQFPHSGVGSCKPEERPLVLVAHCSPAPLAHSIWLRFHSSPCKRMLGELRSLLQPTPCSTAWYEAGWLQKNQPHVFLMRLFPCPGNLPLRWSGHLHQNVVSVWRAGRALVPPVTMMCGQAVIGLAGSPLLPLSWMGPWLWPRDHPNTDNFPAPSPVQGVLFRETL